MTLLYEYMCVRHFCTPSPLLDCSAEHSLWPQKTRCMILTRMGARLEVRTKELYSLLFIMLWKIKYTVHTTLSPWGLSLLQA